MLCFQNSNINMNLNDVEMNEVLKFIFKSILNIQFEFRHSIIIEDTQKLDLFN
jgi:hypothetical protein